MYRRQPDPLLALKQACAVPAIPSSDNEIAEIRERIEFALDSLTPRGVRVESLDQLAFPSLFYLAYHGSSNRRIFEKLSKVLRTGTPGLEFTAAHCRQPRKPTGRIRVGFISQFFRRHSIGKTSYGLIAHLPRDRFEVVTLFIPPKIDDEVSRAIQLSSDKCLELPSDIEGARRAIAAFELDVLFFQDIGMEPKSYVLAHSRLAPLQCVSFGHPDTTGIPTVDYFVSSDLYEPELSHEHYSERLFQLRQLPTLAHYIRPKLVGSKSTRAHLGLDPDARLYLCPQMLFKIHPEFDGILIEILRRDPKGQLILVNRNTSFWSAAILRRLSALAPDVISRVRVGAGWRGDDYLSALANCDVMLDTPHFNGMNTSLEAFAMGTPVVTWPRALQRGRHTAGMYRRMGLDALIVESADTYVDRAVAIASDAGLRSDLSRDINERTHVLYEDPAACAEFARFFEEALFARLAETL
jgi:predicted O-linked N-acetylglucosamine transferase (SPINDLY family)